MCSRIILLIIFLSGSIYGQKLELHIEDSITKIEGIQDRASINKKLQGLKLEAIRNGYLAWSVDSIQFSDSLNIAFIHRGQKYSWKSLEWVNPPKLNDKITKTTFDQRVFNPDELFMLINALLDFYSNHGHPFAQIKLDSTVVEGETISSKIEIFKGPKITLDTLAILGDLKISRAFMEQYLNLVPGEPFDQSKLNDVRKKLSTLPFAKQKQASRIIFSNNIATIQLFLDEKSANFLNGIIGVLPNTNTDPRLSTGNNLIITGDVELKVFNMLHLGERFAAKWKRLQAQSQELKLDFLSRYLWGTPFGINEELDLLKQDTSFINFSNVLGLNYSFSNTSFGSFFWEHQSSTILTENPNFSNNAATSNLFGLKIQTENFDYPFNPTKGYGFSFSFSAGTKEIAGKEKDGLVEVNVPQLTSNVSTTLKVPKQSPIFRFSGGVDYFWKLYRNSTIKTALQGSWIVNDYLFDNELIRIGGFSSLRGFDERSIFASNFVHFNMEYRFILEQNSFLFVFAEQARVQQNTLFNNEIDYPSAFGSGIAFETNAGIFTVSYALGRQQNNPIEFRSAKIHFGFTSLF
jgi:outer membrane protein assembly factor BamA